MRFTNRGSLSPGVFVVILLLVGGARSQNGAGGLRRLTATSFESSASSDEPPLPARVPAHSDPEAAVPQQKSAVGPSIFGLTQATALESSASSDEPLPLSAPPPPRDAAGSVPFQPLSAGISGVTAAAALESSASSDEPASPATAQAPDVYSGTFPAPDASEITANAAGAAEGAPTLAADGSASESGSLATGAAAQNVPVSLDQTLLPEDDLANIETAASAALDAQVASNELTPAAGAGSAADLQVDEVVVQVPSIEEVASTSSNLGGLGAAVLGAALQGAGASVGQTMLNGVAPAQGVFSPVPGVMNVIDEESEAAQAALVAANSNENGGATLSQAASYLLNGSMIADPEAVSPLGAETNASSLLGDAEAAPAAAASGSALASSAANNQPVEEALIPQRAEFAGSPAAVNEDVQVVLNETRSKEPFLLAERFNSPSCRDFFYKSEPGKPFAVWEMLHDAYPWVEVEGGANSKKRPPASDLVVCPEQRLVYVDNMKAASALVKKLLGSTYNCSWYDWSWTSSKEPPSQALARAGEPSVRTTSVLLDETFPKEDYFFFSVVREPVSRFISGFQKAQSDDATLADMSAAEYIGLYKEGNPNEHTTTQACLLNGRDATGQQIPLHFLGRMETLQEDLDILTHHLGLPRLVVPQRQRRRLVVEPPRELEERRRLGGSESELSRGDIQRLCAHLVQDFACFGYEMPPECVA